MLSLCPAPTAAFTSEGGFKPPHDFTWSAAAEEEMNDASTACSKAKARANEATQGVDPCPTCW